MAHLRRFLLIFPVVLVCGFGQSSSPAAWLAGAAQALGGAAALRSLTAVELSGVSVWRQREQSERPEGPWVATFTDFTDVRNFSADAVKRTQRVRGYSTPDWIDNKEWTPESTMLVAAGVGLRRANGALAPTSTPWDIGALPLGLGPERVVLAAIDAKDAHAEPDEMLNGYAHHVVAFTYAGARVRLILNVPSLLPKAIEVTQSRPYDMYWAPWGDVTQRVTLGVWTLEAGGIVYPRLWEYSTGGQTDGTVTITQVKINPAVTAADFDVPADIRQRLAARPRVAATPLGNPQRPATELAPGVVLVPGSWNVVEIKQDDGVVIFEGPLASEYSAKAIDDATKRFGGARVKAVITTSDSWPHIGGMREYAARGIPIYALDLNVPILTRLFEAKYVTSPDTLAKAPKRPDMHVVSGKTVVGAGANRLEIYPYRTATGERQMMVYLPQHQLLYTSDLFTITPTMVFLPQQVAEAVEAVTRERLAVTSAFGMHYGMLPWATIVKSAAPPAR
ncbi:MAG TPA: MBL fold metallo-hydrolase [Vicinamibacterales bacterium]|nr:MBL fold metallo-hydrolase [Vicinamibacterales bacterium]